MAKVTKGMVKKAKKVLAGWYQEDLETGDLKIMPDDLKESLTGKPDWMKDVFCSIFAEMTLDSIKRKSDDAKRGIKEPWER